MDIRKLEKQLKLSGNLRNPDWVTKQIKKGRIQLLDTLLTPENFKDFRIAIKVISEVYENQWDFAFQLINTGRSKVTIYISGIVIHFPEVTITNRNNHSHKIKDLFVKIRLEFHEAFLKVQGISGARTYLKYAEWQNNYFHSHLPTTSSEIPHSNGEPTFVGFCTGSGEINMYRADINSDGFTEERFLKYAVQIMSLVSYESIEGTPYRFLRDIRTRPSNGRVFQYTGSVCTTFKNTVLAHYKGHKRKPEVDIILNSQGLYEIVNNEKFKKFLYDVPYGSRRNYFCLADPTNSTYYTIEGIPGYTAPPVITDTFVFRNEELKVMQIEPAPRSLTVDVQEEIHPNLIIYIKKEIEYELNKNKIRKSTINRYKPESDNAREGVTSDPIPVSTDSQSGVVRDTIL